MYVRRGPQRRLEHGRHHQHHHSLSHHQQNHRHHVVSSLPSYCIARKAKTRKFLEYKAFTRSIFHMLTYWWINSRLVVFVSKLPLCSIHLIVWLNLSRTRWQTFEINTSDVKVINQTLLVSLSIFPPGWSMSLGSEEMLHQNLGPKLDSGGEGARQN